MTVVVFGGDMGDRATVGPRGGSRDQSAAYGHTQSGRQDGSHPGPATA
jgi:hypothetical protein